MSRPRWVQEIEDKSGSKPVLLVEGDVDTRIVAYFLEQVSPGWETGVILLSAGYKSRVIEGVRNYHPEWVGIIDTDEWTLDQVQRELTQLPRVRALPRFCLENYFCVPEELWSALPLIQQEAVGNDPSRLAQPVLTLLPDWVAHGAIWRVIRSRRTGLLNQSGFPAKLDNVPVTDLAEIRRILESWHAQLDPDQIINEYQQALDIAQRLTTDEQLKSYVHGKKFFNQVIVSTLNQLFGQRDAYTWLQTFTQPPYGLNTPPDLEEFLLEVLNLFE